MEPEGSLPHSHPNNELRSILSVTISFQGFTLQIFY